jgi:hypothetical protein
MLTRTARDSERGQTLPIWTFAVLAALALMFFSLNYANVIRAQVRAQTVADMLAQTMLGVQATRWNKLTMALYAADVEEYRIRSLMASMYDAANEEGPCNPVPDDLAHYGSCLNIYNALVPQLYKAVIRYKADAYAIDALSYQQSEANTVQYEGMRATSEIACGQTPAVSSECGQFHYHTINFGYRSTTQAVIKDALYTHVGGVTGTAPAVNWQPLQIEVSVCETVNPITTIFGAQPAPIVGRAAATMAPITTEWLAPGVTANPNNSGNPFQGSETVTADPYSANPLPERDWYGTQFRAQPYTAISATDYGMTGSALADDFEVWVPWWGVIPIAPYSGAQTSVALCTADPSM